LEEVAATVPDMCDANDADLLCTPEQVCACVDGKVASVTIKQPTYPGWGVLCIEGKNERNIKKEAEEYIPIRHSRDSMSLPIVAATGYHYCVLDWL
jgi:hypothetical protein